MKLYLWEDVLTHYDSGLIFALANNLEEAKKAVQDKYKKQWNTLNIDELLEKEMETTPRIITLTEGFYINGSM